MQCAVVHWLVKEAFTSVVLPVGLIRCGSLKCAAV